MRPATWWYTTLLLLLLTGCSTTNDVVSKGPFQKRKYRSGWHMDLGSAKRTEAASRTIARSTIERVEPRRMATQNLQEPTASLISVERPKTAHRISQGKAEEQSIGSPDMGRRVHNLSATVSSVRIDEPPSEPRRWNRMALVSGAFLGLSLLVLAAGGGYFLGYVLVFSFLTGLIGLLLCIKHKERGKGIAIAAMAFPLALLAAVILALNSWT